MIVTHRSQASELLESLQREGICQILNADEAAVSKDYPELSNASERPRDVEELLARLTKCIEFLTPYSQVQKGLASVLAPRAVIDERAYERVVCDQQMLGTIGKSEQTAAEIERLNSERENLQAALEMLGPWRSLETPVEELGELRQAACLGGLLPAQQREQTVEKLAELGGAVEQFGVVNNRYACLIACLKDQVGDVQKLLRAAEFEAVSFESMTGTVRELIEEHREKLHETEQQLQQHYQEAGSLAKDLLNLKILHDHYSNLANREQAKSTAPATEQTIILEGWVKEPDYLRLEQIVSGFDASSLSRVRPGEEESIPVDIENRPAVKPFEVITRLYGMPDASSLDPTPFLAPFFALFFGICLTDVGYGLLLSLILWRIMKKFQGDKGAFRMMLMCAAMSVVAGAVTGGWFSDAFQSILPEGTAIYNVLNALRNKLMLFDPMKQPMVFFAISLILGYAQVQFGLLISFCHRISQRRYLDGIFDPLAWIIFLNSLVLFILAKQALIPGFLSGFFATTAILMAVVILFLSERQGGWGARIGMGAFGLFSTVFYFGDVLSYVRLMALGMVTGGLGIAVNILVKLLMEKGPFGYLAGAVLFVGAHIFNLAVSLLSAFVHTLRLQYVEFFPKFLQGSGAAFQPLQVENKYVYIED
ncbi:MAG: V-type ATP synthase subunit I [Planctomycetota bacterium]